MHQNPKAFWAGHAPAGQLPSFACPKEGNPRKRHPLHRPSGSLRCSPSRAAAQLARSAVRTRAQTVLAEFPGSSALLGAAAGAPKNQTILDSKSASVSLSKLDNSGFCSASILLACRQDAGATRSGSTQKQLICRVLALIPIGVTQLIQEHLKRWFFLRRHLDSYQHAAVVGAVVAVVE